jgi:hypothetical protein
MWKLEGTHDHIYSLSNPSQMTTLTTFTSVERLKPTSPSYQQVDLNMNQRVVNNVPKNLEATNHFGRDVQQFWALEASGIGEVGY